MQELLDELAFLQKLAQDEVNYIMSGAVEERTFNAGQFLYAQDEPVRFVYLLLEGTVDEVRTTLDAAGRAHQTLKRIAGPGTQLGLYDFLSKHEHSTRDRTREAGRLLAIRATALERLIYRFPDVRSSLAPLAKIERLRTIPFLADLDWVALGFVADITSERLEYKPQAPIYTLGEATGQIYLIDQGQIELTWPDGANLLLGNGATLGIVQQTGPMVSDLVQLDHTATARTPTWVYAMPRANLRDLLGLNPDERGFRLRRLVIDTLDSLKVFRNFTPTQRKILAGFVSHYCIPNNYLIVHQGEPSESLWVLLPGYRAKIHALNDDGQALLSTGAEGPNYFGESALIAQLPTESTIEAEANSQWLRLHYRDFQRFVQENGRELPRKLILRTQAVRLLETLEERQEYPWLQENEILATFARHHWIVLLGKTAFGQILVIGLLIGLFFLPQLSAMTAFVVAWLLGLIGVIAVLQIAWGLVDYLNDYLMITNRRVVRQEKVIFVNEWRQEAGVDQIQNVTTSQTFLGKLLDYGRLDVQTAAVRGGIRFNYLPNPDAVKQAIFAQRDIREEHKRAEDKIVIQRMLAGRLGRDLQLPDRVYIVQPKRVEPLTEPWWMRLLRQFRQRFTLQRTVQDRIIWRKHWVVLIGQIFAPLMMTGAIGLAFLIQFLPVNIPDRVIQLLFTFNLLLALLGLINLIWIAWRVTDWRNDTFEVNRQEILDVTKQPLFLSETRRTARLTDITNVEVDIPTPFHYWLDFGNVRLETAGREGDLTFDNVPGPREVAAEINRRIADFRRQEQLDQARRRAQELPDWFELYNRLEPEKAEDRGQKSEVRGQK